MENLTTGQRLSQINDLKVMRKAIFEIANSFGGNETGDIAVMLHSVCNGLHEGIQMASLQLMKNPRVYVLASLNEYGHNKHGWVSLERKVSKDQDGGLAFTSIEEAEKEMETLISAGVLKRTNAHIFVIRRGKNEGLDS